MDREYVMRQLPLVLLPVLLTQQVIILLLVGQGAWWWWYLAWLQPVGWVWMAWAWVVFCRRLRKQRREGRAPKNRRSGCERREVASNYSRGFCGS